MTRVLIKRGNSDTDTQQGRLPREVKSYAAARQVTTGSEERRLEQALPWSPQREHSPAYTLISDFQPTEVSVVEATVFVVLCNGGPSKRLHMQLTGLSPYHHSVSVLFTSSQLCILTPCIAYFHAPSTLKLIPVTQLASSSHAPCLQVLGGWPHLWPLLS